MRAARDLTMHERAGLLERWELIDLVATLGEELQPWRLAQNTVEGTSCDEDHDLIATMASDLAAVGIIDEGTHDDDSD